MKRSALRLAVIGCLVGASGLVTGGALASSCADGTVDPNYDRTGDGLAGVCIDVGQELPFQGGSVEAGLGDGSGDNGGAYVVVEGDEQNSGSGAGYIGLSTYENGDSDSSQDGCETSSGGQNSTNSGGCLDVQGDGQPGAEVPGSPIVCGNTTGDWDASSRNGCAIP